MTPPQGPGQKYPSQKKIENKRKTAEALAKKNAGLPPPLTGAAWHEYRRTQPTDKEMMLGHTTHQPARVPQINKPSVPDRSGDFSSRAAASESERTLSRSVHSPPRPSSSSSGTSSSHSAPAPTQSQPPPFPIMRGCNLPSSWSAETLLEKPELLTHARTGNTTFTISEGMVGAVCDGGRSFITSPNEDQIYEPPLGVRTVYPREDGRYGDDDPVQWPQPYVADLPHLAFIRRRSDHPDSSVLWETPTAHDIDDCVTSAVIGLGRLDSRFLERLTKIVDILRPRVLAYKASESRDPKKTPNRRVTNLALFAEHILNRLKTDPLTSAQITFSVAELQRAALELDAAIEYLLKYQPIMCGSAEPDAADCVRVVGVIVVDPWIGATYQRAQAPVWFLRPIQDLVKTRIEKTVSCRRPADDLVLRTGRSRWSPIFTGGATDMQKYRAMERFSSKYFARADPFSVQSAPQQVTRSNHQNVPSAPTSSSAAPQVVYLLPPARQSATRSSKWASSSKKKTTTKVPPRVEPAARDRFAPIHSPYMPPSVPAWAKALQNVDRSVSLVHPNDAVGYVMPEPGLILSTVHEAKMVEYIRGYLKNRVAFVFRLVAPIDNKAEPIRSSNWRDLLLVSGNSAIAPKKDGSRAAVRSETMKKFLADLLLHDGLQEKTEEETDKVYWRDVEIISGVVPDRRLLQEIIWDLTEINFRFEMLALAGKFDPDPTGPDDLDANNESDYRTLVARCFPGGRDVGTYALIDNGNDIAHDGLGSTDWRVRHQYLLALRTVMKAWEREPAFTKIVVDEDVDQCTEEQVLALEAALAAYYTQAFYTQFGRPCMIPHSLPSS